MGRARGGQGEGRRVHTRGSCQQCTRASIQGQAGCALAGRQRQGQTTPPSHTPTDLGVQSVTAGQRIDVDARAVNWNIVHLQGVRESQRSDSIADMRSASHRTKPKLEWRLPVSNAPQCSS